MSNLILDKDKKQIRREYLARLAILVLLFALILLFLSTLLSLPSYILSKDRANTVEKRLSFLRDYIESQKDDDLSLIIRDTKEKLNRLSGKEPEKVFEIIKIITENENRNISLSSLSYRLMPDKSSQLSITGISADRDSLISFRKSLEAEKKFKKINLPISDLAESTDLEFSISLDLENTNAEEN